MFYQSNNLFLILILVALVYSCKLTNEDERIEPEPSYPALEGTKWTLEAFEPVNDEIKIVDYSFLEPYIISFERDSSLNSTIKAIGGCNMAWGNFIENNSNGGIDIELSWTNRVNCTWANEFKGAFENRVYKYGVIEEKLFLYHDSNQSRNLNEGRMRFRRGVDDEHPFFN